MVNSKSRSRTAPVQQKQALTLLGRTLAEPLLPRNPHYSLLLYRILEPPQALPPRHFLKSTLHDLILPQHRPFILPFNVLIQHLALLGLNH